MLSPDEASVPARGARPIAAVESGWRHLLTGLALALACYDEWRQLMLPGREADLYDLLANTVGIALAVWFATRLTAKEG